MKDNDLKLLMKFAAVMYVLFAAVFFGILRQVVLVTLSWTRLWESARIFDRARLNKTCIAED